MFSKGSLTKMRLVPAVAEKSISSLQKAINEGKAKLRQAGNENLIISENAKKLEEALAAEQSKATDLQGKLTFYGGAYQKLQSKLTGAADPVMLCLRSLVGKISEDFCEIHMYICPLNLIFW